MGCIRYTAAFTDSPGHAGGLFLGRGGRGELRGQRQEALAGRGLRKNTTGASVPSRPVPEVLDLFGGFGGVSICVPLVG